MPTRFEVRLQERVKYDHGLVCGNEPCRKSQDVRIVMVTTELCHFRYPCQGAPHFWVSVRGDAHANTAAADEHTESGLAQRNCIGNRMRDVRIIHALWTMRSEILAHPTELSQTFNNLLLQLEAGMVAAYGNGPFHAANIPVDEWPIIE